MEHIKTFLDTSTIHGLSWISSSTKWSKLIWILIVIGGFTGAGYLIYESFHNWQQSPITTTIETLPISEIIFPNVTVCPPKNSLLELNYDIMKANEIHGPRPSYQSSSSLTGASLIISMDGCTLCNHMLRLAIDGCKLLFNPCFQ